MRIKKYALGPMGANCYIVWDESSKDAAVIDPGYPDERVTDLIKRENLSVSKILLTHGHFDHIGGLDMMRKACPEAKTYIHEADADCLSSAGKNLSTMAGRQMVFEPAECLMKNGDSIAIGQDDVLKVLHTPGHTEGGVCFIGKEVVFSGDTLFQGSIGRTDFPGGDYETMMRSLDKLMQMGDGRRIYPGHGEETDLAFERRMNPFVRRRGQW